MFMTTTFVRDERHLANVRNPESNSSPRDSSAFGSAKDINDRRDSHLTA